MQDKIMSLYPSTKFTTALFIGISAFVIPTYWYGFAGFLICILIACMVKEGKAYLKTIRNSLMILAIFMFIMRSLFSDGTTILMTLGPLSVSEEGVENGLRMVSEVLALGGALLLFFKITPVKKSPPHWRISVCHRQPPMSYYRRFK